MKISDLHMHGNYSDGNGNPEDFIKAAISMGLETIGISDHSPLPLENCWSMEMDKLDGYVSEITQLKKKFSDRIDVLTGIELDYIDGIDVPGYIDFDSRGFDYFIGSVHYVYSELLDGFFEVDGPPESFKSLVEEGFGNDAGMLVASYYSSVRKMIKAYKPRIIGHIDLIKKNNQVGRFFNEDSSEYRREVDGTLAEAKRCGSLIEINTGAMSRGYTKSPYPSDYILEKCLSDGIGITLNSDAHEPKNICYKFEEMFSHAREVGFDRIQFMHREGIRTFSL